MVRGDCLLYEHKGFFGWIVAVKTWHSVAHVEVFAGQGKSWASRDGKGVGLYPIRWDGLYAILRPKTFNPEDAFTWAQSVNGKSYGWLELLNFVGVPIRNKGIFCSQFATILYRKGGMNLFPEDPADEIAPFQFMDLVGTQFDIIWKKAV